MSQLFQTSPYLESSAVLSRCGKYRYRLYRVWDERKPLVAWCMLNPSTADAEVDDPTIRRCMSFARSWDHGGIVVVNLFALRTAYPAELRQHPHPCADPNHDGQFSGFFDNENDAHIVTATDGLRFIAAWGTWGSLHGRDRELYERWFTKRKMECLGVTSGGFPRHPLYVAGAVTPVPFSPLPPKAEGSHAS